MPSDEFVGPPSSEPISKPSSSTSDHSICEIIIDAMKESIKVKDRLITYLKADLDKFMVNGKNPYEKSLVMKLRALVYPQVLFSLSQ